MIRFIIFFTVIMIWVIWNVFKAGNRKNSAGKPETSAARNRCAGKKYFWTWMQTAGAFQLQFIRPEESGGYPAISGMVHGIAVTVQGRPPSDGRPESTQFRFRFPESAQIGLSLRLSANPSELKKAAGNRSSQSMQDILQGRTLKGYFLQVGNPEIFKRCLSAECLDCLCRLHLIYPGITLTDTELLVNAAGINNDLQGFQQQLKALLEAAECFAAFAAGCAARKKMTVSVSSPPEPVREKLSGDGKQDSPAEEKPEAAPDRGIGENPEPASASIPEKTVFLHTLCSAGSTPQQQKAFFEKYLGAEVEWSGSLKMFYSYSTDFVFGQTSGVKAAFDLYEFKPEGSFIPVKIKAVVSFSEDAGRPFRNAYGKTFRFRGKLLKFEPVAREIFLSGGMIIGVES